MYSSEIVNCPFCEADIEISKLASSTQCPFCEKKFNIEDGRRTREIIMHGLDTKVKKGNDETSGVGVETSKVHGKPKFCSECGRKLVADARYCDWCGVKI